MSYTAEICRVDKFVEKPDLLFLYERTTIMHDSLMGRNV